VKQAEDIEITQNQYMRGVKIKSFNFERLNPEAKVINLNFNQTVLEIKNQYDVFEVLLIKDFKKVTECSRSNIFFIKDNSIFKARSIDILSGITGMHVLNICKQNSIPVIEKDIYINDLNTFESAFITGTSPGVLAVSKIDKQKYSVNNTIRQFISDHYFSSVDNYIQNIKLNKSLSLWKYS
jgi:branched-chain amino acid aminotransferase